MTPRIFSAFVLVASLLATSSAIASPDFPDVIAQTLGTSNVPPCTICHANLSGGAGTVVKPFGQYMQQRGLAAGNTDALKKALQAMIGEKHDTDGDGTTDEDAIKAGKDPNGASSSSVEPIAYGCGGRIAPTAPASGGTPTAFGAAALGLALVFARRVRRRP
jgi:MYXO-CTERM domain-containing protein